MNKVNIAGDEYITASCDENEFLKECQEVSVIVAKFMARDVKPRTIELGIYALMMCQMAALELINETDPSRSVSISKSVSINLNMVANQTVGIPQ